MEECRYGLKNSQCLMIPDSTGAVSFGCDQDWYGSRWKRQAGCGPNVATNMLVYLRCSGRIRLSRETGDKESCMILMEAVWDHVTPSLLGVHTTRHFAKGLQAFGAEHDIVLKLETLEIPRHASKRPSAAVVADFVAEGIDRDCPVAFLNLHNGSIATLDAWHWVTVVGMNRLTEDDACLEIYDGDRTFEADLSAWLGSTKAGGGFVRLASS